MPQNIEVKAKVKSLESLKKKAQQISGEDATVLKQEDTFFNVEKGRLKLRVIEDSHSELIFYERIDKAGPKTSNFNKSPVEYPDELRETLKLALGIKGTVKKTRYLYLVGQTRIHVDDVESIGSFMELEVMMKEGQDESEGQAIAEGLMDKLGIDREDLIEGAYMDLILKKAPVNGTGDS